MNEQLAVQQLLQTKYAEMRGRNPGFSRRAFSKKLGISPGAMSELFSGKRRVSRKVAEHIADRLLLDPQQKSELFSLFPAIPLEFKASENSELSRYLQISSDQFQVIGDWFHFGILTLMRTVNFKSEVQWISERLGIAASVVRGGIERLKRLGMIQENDQNMFTRSESRYRTSDDVANTSVRKAHLQYLEKAREALETVPVEMRDFTSLMMAVDIDTLPKAKVLIRKFQDDLCALMETEEPARRKEVYQLCINLFPLSHPMAQSPNQKVGN